LRPNVQRPTTHHAQVESYATYPFASSVTDARSPRNASAKRSRGLAEPGARCHLFGHLYPAPEAVALIHPPDSGADIPGGIIAPAGSNRWCRGRMVALGQWGSPQFSSQANPYQPPIEIRTGAKRMLPRGARFQRAATRMARWKRAHGTRPGGTTASCRVGPCNVNGQRYTVESLATNRDPF